ncbi:secreted frizzled-related protein 1 isoform X1 [Hippopotamus amphibius kiboko]|uniref:secreted frizzled-related protein 1 isoform X1 n=1 Tax=Hippopotamus amphibius kiboko TaxID=575201 RepID=UPI0025963509|nr:secreted frizzled-related protein 1 isoform X1 [Hippopotamus amphibius kiboko]
MGGGRWAAAGALLALAAGLLAAGSASEYDYVSFQSDIGAYQSGRFYTKPPQCVDIPVDLRLCHNVGYKRMVLPNLLEHETMAEVKQQASSWVPLLNKNCHIGTQVFLCSLFAPVCLDRPIYPCRWLCEAVRDSCEPVMQFFGFYWPEMLKCDKFPEGDVCIAMTPPNATEASKPQGTTVCPPCDNELKSEAIIEHLCASEFEPGRTGVPTVKAKGTASSQQVLCPWRGRSSLSQKIGFTCAQQEGFFVGAVPSVILHMAFQTGFSVRRPALSCLAEASGPCYQASIRVIGSWPWHPALLCQSIRCFLPLRGKRVVGPVMCSHQGCQIPVEFNGACITCRLRTGTWVSISGTCGRAARVEACAGAEQNPGMEGTLSTCTGKTAWWESCLLARCR